MHTEGLFSSQFGRQKVQDQVALSGKAPLDGASCHGGSLYEKQRSRDDMGDQRVWGGQVLQNKQESHWNEFLHDLTMSPWALPCFKSSTLGTSF